jgi:hypothetical protein
MNNEIMELAKTEPLKLKIKDIVELTQIKNVSMIAKEYLPIGEKRLRDILKACGCQAQRGKSGWVYDADNAEVEKELGDFVTKVRKTTKGNSINASNVKSNNKNNNTVIKNSKYGNKDDSTNKNTINSEKDDTTVSEIKALIQGKKKDENARVYKGIYFDRDISEFLDNIQHGNKSELVNKILRQYLMENELM